MRKLAANTVYKGGLMPLLTLVRLNPNHHKPAPRSSASWESDFAAADDQQALPGSRDRHCLIYRFDGQALKRRRPPAEIMPKSLRYSQFTGNLSGFGQTPTR